jgi:hypothetical protein
MYADKYGGDGVMPALGAGRAGFLPEGNLYVKGLGFTPLFRNNDPDDFVHSHGGVHLEDCLSEAIFGEVNHNLFTLGSNRIVAIIDQGRSVVDPNRRTRHLALAVRAGAQLRPGHLLAKRARGSCSPVELFINIARATNQLVTTTNGVEVPNVSATMLRVIDDHARTAAESFRWRMIHGALSPSNMDFSGAMLDLPTQSSQPRTAPIFSLDYHVHAFGAEHKERGFYLAEMYRRVLRATDKSTREHFNATWINVSNEMDKAYEKYLLVNLLAAAGLKRKLAQRIQAEHSDIAGEFTRTLLELSTLKNPGSACVAKKVVDEVAVVDVFNLLAHAPRDYFGDGQGLRKEVVLKRLRPVYKGNRFHVAKKAKTIASLAERFGCVYRELMNVCALYWGDYYDSEEAMKISIAARAAFENEPMPALYYSRLYAELNDAIARYKATGKVRLIADAIDKRIAQSIRSVDGLLAQGNSRRLSDGGIELEMRTFRGISYSVRAWNDGARKLHVSIPLKSSVRDLSSLTEEQIGALRYRFTTDGWKTSNEMTVCLQNGPIIELDLCVSSLIGRLEGFFYSPGLKTRRFGDYAFVVPDRHELRDLQIL